MPPDAPTPRCEIIRPLLSAYLDDEITPTQAALVQAHVTACERCASELAFLRLTHAVLSRAPEAPMPAALSARIAAATYARPTLRQRVSDWLRPAPVRVAALGTAAAFAAAVIAASTLLRGGAGPAPQTASDAAPEKRAPAAVAPPAKKPVPSQVARQPAPAPRRDVTAPRPKKQIPPAAMTAQRDDAPARQGRGALPVAVPGVKPEKRTVFARADAPTKTVPPVPKPEAAVRKPAPTVVVKAPSPAPDLRLPDINPPTPLVVNGSDTLRNDPPAPLSDKPDRVAPAPERRFVRIPVTRPREQQVAEIVRIPFSGRRGDAIRPVGFPEPGQPNEADVAFVSAPVH